MKSGSGTSGFLEEIHKIREIPKLTFCCLLDTTLETALQSINRRIGAGDIAASCLKYWRLFLQNSLWLPTSICSTLFNFIIIQNYPLGPAPYTPSAFASAVVLQFAAFEPQGRLKLDDRCWWSCVLSACDLNIPVRVHIAKEKKQPGQVTRQQVRCQSMPAVKTSVQFPRFELPIIYNEQAQQVTPVFVICKLNQQCCGMSSHVII